MEGEGAMTTADVQRLLDDIFEEQALVVGGLMELHDASAVFVRQFFKSLAATRTHALERLAGGDTTPAAVRGSGAAARPAVEEFLAEIGRS